MGESLLDASVIVATKDRPDLLLDLVRILATPRPFPREIIVVGAGSRAAVGPEALASLVPFRVRVIRNESTLGPAASRNRGVHASRGALLLFTDDDCVVDPEWVQALCEPFHPSGDPLLGGVG